MSIRYAIKELLVRRHRTIVNCIGIAVSVALVISLFSLSTAYKEAVRKPFEESGVDLVLERPKTDNGNNATVNGVILPDSAKPIAGSEVQKLTEIEGIESIAVSLQVWSFDKGSFKVIVGIDPDSPDIGLVMFKNWVSDGRFFDSGETGVAVVEKHYAKSYGIKVDDTIEISGEAFRIIGTVQTKEGSQLSAPNIFLPINEARRLAVVGTDDVNTIYIRLESAANSKAITDQIKEAITGIKISSPDSSLSAADSLFSLSEQFTWLISLVVIVVAVFLIFKTVSSNIFERIKEIGIMKAVGWTGGNIRRQLTLEMVIQAVAGGILGIVSGLLLSFGLSIFKINAPMPWQGSPIPGSTDMSAASTNLVPLQISISPVFLLTVFVATVLITVLCGLAASNKASGVKPAESLRKI